LGVSGPPSASADPAGDQELVATATPEVLKRGSGVFTLNVSDKNPGGVVFDSYVLSGLPTGWVVKEDGVTLTPFSPDPVIYSLSPSVATSGKVTIEPPASFAGALPGVTLGRVAGGANLITDFNNGTFDYIGEAKPKLSSANTPYGYHDPTVTYTGNPPGGCRTQQYGPCDGDYTIWPTANINGPSTHWNNFWADLRSIDNPLTTPSTSTICNMWKGTNPNGTGHTQTQLTSAQSAASGKIAIFNGSLTMPVPHNLLSTTVTNLSPNRAYLMSVYVANLSDDPRTVAPVRASVYAEQAEGGVGVLIGSSQPLPKQADCLNYLTKWQKFYGVVSTGDSNSLRIGLRNFAEGGIGNDLAIDNLFLHELIVSSFDLQVRNNLPKLDLTKTSDPATGSQVAPRQTITYTITGANTGESDLDPVTLTDDLSAVLANADLVPGSLQASVNGSVVPAPVITGTTLTWVGPLNAGQTVVVTYQVTVKAQVSAGVVIANQVTGKAEDPEGPVTTNCTIGDEEPACGSEVTVVRLDPPNPRLTVAKTSNPVTGATVAPGDTITYTIRGSNAGDTALDPVTLTDDLSAVLAKASLTPGSLQASVDGSAVSAPVLTDTTLTWAGALSPNQEVTITYQVTVNKDLLDKATVSNRVTGKAVNPKDPDTPVPSNCVTGAEQGCGSDLTIMPQVTPDPALTVGKTSSPASGSPVAPGGTITYTIRGANTGNSALDPVTLTDDLSEVLAQASLVPGSLKAEVEATPVSAPVLTGTTLTWQGALSVGQAVTITYQVNVNKDLKGSVVIKNRVVGKADNPETPHGPGSSSNCITGEEPGCYTETPVTETRLADPGLSVTKTSTPVSGSMVAPGEKITFTIRSTNIGNTDLNPVTLTDDLSSVLTHASLVPESLKVTIDSSPASAPVLAGNTLTWEGALKSGQVVVITYQVTVNTKVADGAVISNRVTSQAIDPDDPEGPSVPSNCGTGEGTDCSTKTTVKVPPPKPVEVKTGGSVVSYPWLVRALLAWFQI
jgi:fimbrial isopeptide formation D2 family protein